MAPCSVCSSLISDVECVDDVRGPVAGAISSLAIERQTPGKWQRVKEHYYNTRRHRLELKQTEQRKEVKYMMHFRLLKQRITFSFQSLSFSVIGASPLPLRNFAAA